MTVVFCFVFARATEGRDIFSRQKWTLWKKKKKRRRRRRHHTAVHYILGTVNYIDDDDNLPLLVPSNKVSYLSSHEE
jgi:hypothetical protein